MTSMTLIRDSQTANGMFGRLMFGDFQCVTVEKPWLDNQPFVSCIPAGTYKVSRTRSGRFGRCIAVVNEDIGITRHETAESVRYAILIHPANLAEQLEGCIAPGREFADFNGVRGVTSSRATVNDLYALLTEPAELEIIDNYG